MNYCLNAEILKSMKDRYKCSLVSKLSVDWSFSPRQNIVGCVNEVQQFATLQNTTHFESLLLKHLLARKTV